MGFGEAISSCYSHYATFSGRASRSEYWFFQLFHLLLTFGCCLFILAGGLGIALICLAAIVNFLPLLCVFVRRLHDTDHSGWWYWFALVPIIGPILLLVWTCTRGTWGDNRFGADPLSGESPPPPHPGFAPPPGDLAEQLAKLARLRADGTLSEEEFQRLKTKLI